MERPSVSRTIDAPASVAWDHLVDVRRWPSWGTSIRSARLDDGADRIGPGATGSVATVLGVSLPFRITEWADGSMWRWRVAGLPATGHIVRSLDDGRCTVAMDVPWYEAPYLAVCRIALGALARELEQ